jgi:hypothetical protein
MLSNHPNCLGGNGPSASSDLIGDVDGPASATDNAVARFDGTTGKLIKNSVVTIADSTGAIAGASSLTSPASTDLTLAGGSSGASLVLGQGTGYAVATSTDTGTAGEQIALVASATTSGTPTAGYGPSLRFFRKGNDGGAAGSAASVRAVAIAGTGGSQYNSNLTLAARLAGNMVDVLTATGAGTVSIPSSTAGSANAGALVVTGGLATGAASYIGGAVTVNGAGTFGAGININPVLGPVLKSSQTGAFGWQLIQDETVTGNLILQRLVSSSASDVLTFVRSSGAATFAGAVTATGNLTVSGTGNNTIGGDLLVGSGAWPSTNFGRSESRMVIAGAAGGGVLGIGDTQAGVAANRGGSLYLFARGTTATADIAGAALISKRANATSGNFSSSLELGVSTSSISNPVTQLTLTETTATFAGAVTIAGTVIHTLSATPASASATGTVGTMSWDASYIYICTAANTWKRVAIATW